MRQTSCLGLFGRPVAERGRSDNSAHHGGFWMAVLLLPIWVLSYQVALAADPGAAPAHHGRVTWEEHFAAANLAHDGHLTREEAQGGYGPIGKHFDDIDVDHKGYVTLNDVRAWRVMKKAAHRLTQPPREERLKPLRAMQLVPLAPTDPDARMAGRADND